MRTGGAAVDVIVPERSFRDQSDVPDTPTDGIHVETDDGRQEVVTPHTRPRGWPGVLMVTERHVAAWWRSLPDDLLAAEYDHRQEAGDPIPPILEELAA